MKLKPIGDNVIIKGIAKKSEIYLGEGDQNYQIEKFEVYAIGDKVDKVKVGDEVLISLVIFKEQSRLINPIKGKTIPEGEFYLVAKDYELIGVFK